MFFKVRALLFCKTCALTFAQLLQPFPITNSISISSPFESINDMEQYTKLSNLNISFDLKPLLSSSSNAETVWQKPSTIVTQKASLPIWIATAWTLVMHGILSVIVTIFLFGYVDGRYFSPIERSPLVQVVGGTRLAPFCPMQSDIVTILSSMIAILRTALSAWIASLSCGKLLFAYPNGLRMLDAK
ncbi:unnamed protein product [Rhizoctonia solani]|uniref:Uncharacterized protein n=1 Tax=Rhizoctonia solani TaxID=456999 RepID=A0A8H3HZ75_9AGAM|nr:unnamed protein product [Rhizoctonia solani]